MSKILLWIIGIGILIGLVVYLTKSTPVSAPAPEIPVRTQTEPTPMSEATTTATTMTDTTTATTTTKVVAITIHASNFTFSPATLTVKQGQTVKLTFVNDDGFHDFVIDEFAGARTKQIKAGVSETIEFVAGKQGTFAYYCSVGQHRAMGMEGKLMVE